MALLLYCVAEADSAVNDTLRGVAQLPVLRLKRQTLATFASETSTAEVWTTRPLAQAALEFHYVLADLFRSTAIIPFRFPTILGSGRELDDHLRERAREYRNWLRQFRTLVQWEAFISDADSMPGEPARSGTEYLRAKQSRADLLAHLAWQLQLASGQLAKQWRTRITQSGLRCYALVEREMGESLRGALATVALPTGCKLRLTGPWPPTQFLHPGQV
jgi:hypothetical protein